MIVSDLIDALSRCDQDASVVATFDSPRVIMSVTFSDGVATLNLVEKSFTANVLKREREARSQKEVHNEAL